MEYIWLIVTLICIMHYVIGLIIMENQNLMIEQQRFVLNQTYFEPSKDFKS